MAQLVELVSVSGACHVLCRDHRSLLQLHPPVKLASVTPVLRRAVGDARGQGFWKRPLVSQLTGLEVPVGGLL